MIEVSIATAPAVWASYLVNGDATGIDLADIVECDAWIARLASEGWRVVSTPDDDDGFFTWHCDAMPNIYVHACEYVLHRVTGSES